MFEFVKNTFYVNYQSTTLCNMYNTASSILREMGGVNPSPNAHLMNPKSRLYYSTGILHFMSLMKFLILIIFPLFPLLLSPRKQPV